MEISNFREHPEKCYHFNINDERYNGYFIEVKEDEEVYSAYLCEEMWPREKALIYFNYKRRMTFDEFMEVLQMPMTEAFIRDVMKRMSKFEDIPSKK